MRPLQPCTMGLMSDRFEERPDLRSAPDEDVFAAETENGKTAVLRVSAGRARLTVDGQWVDAWPSRGRLDDLAWAESSAQTGSRQHREELYRAERAAKPLPPPRVFADAEHDGRDAKLLDPPTSPER